MPDSYFVLIIALTIFGTVSFLKGHCERRLRRVIMQNGVESKATLLGIEQISQTENPAYQVLRLRLQVNRGKNRNYVTEIDHRINHTQVHHLKIGNKVKVKYNPKRPKQVLLICETGPADLFD